MNSALLIVDDALDDRGTLVIRRGEVADMLGSEGRIQSGLSSDGT